MKLFKDYKAIFIVVTVLWILGTIILVAPLSVSVVACTNETGTFNLTEFFGDFPTRVSKFNSVGDAFKPENFGTFAQWLGIYTIALAISTVISVVKMKPKSGFENIEHGSSDWCEGGEQYRILSKKNGIILAQNNYLPVDKIGNVNVLVVGGSGSGKSASY